MRGSHTPARPSRLSGRTRGRCGVAGTPALFRLPSALGAFLSAAALLLTLGACSGATLSHSAVESKIGRATFRDIVVEVPDIFGANGFSIHETRRTGNSVSFETDWRARAPFEDEAEQGADRARTRLLLDARRAGGRTYSLRIRAENEVRGVPGASGPVAGSRWGTIPATEMYRAYVRDLFMQIKLEVDAGVRVH